MATRHKGEWKVAICNHICSKFTQPIALFAVVNLYHTIITIFIASRIQKKYIIHLWGTNTVHFAQKRELQRPTPKKFADVCASRHCGRSLVWWSRLPNCKDKKKNHSEKKSCHAFLSISILELDSNLIRFGS